MTDARVGRDETTVRWRYVRHAPNDPCAAFAVVTVQYVLVSVPRTDGTVSFRQRRTLFTRCSR